MRDAQRVRRCALEAAELNRNSYRIISTQLDHDVLAAITKYHEQRARCRLMFEQAVQWLSETDPGAAARLAQDPELAIPLPEVIVFGSDDFTVRITAKFVSF